MKCYLSEIILITCTNNINIFEQWLFWHKNIIGFEHIIVVDNNSIVDLKSVCDKYQNVEYVYKPGSISQSDTYNYYVNNSKAYWCLPIDDDEFVYISDKYNNNINNLIIKMHDEHKEFFKLSFMWAMMFSKDIIQSRNLSDPVFKDFTYMYTKTEFIEHIINIKTLVNTLVKHYYVKDTDPLIRIKYEDLDLPPEKLIYWKNAGWNMLIPYDHMGTVHNPISKLFDTYIHAYNVTNGFTDIGYLGHKNLEITDDAYICHYKFRSFDEWKYKIYQRSKYNDLYSDYDAHYMEETFYKAYSYKDKFIENLNPLKLWEKYH